MFYTFLDGNQNRGAQLDYQGNILDKFKINPTNGLGGVALTRYQWKVPMVNVDKTFYMFYTFLDGNQNHGAQLDYQGNILDKFQKNPTSGLGGVALTRSQR